MISIGTFKGRTIEKCVFEIFLVLSEFFNFYDFFRALRCILQFSRHGDIHIPFVCVSMSENLSGTLTDDQLRSVEPKIA